MTGLSDLHWGDQKVTWKKLVVGGFSPTHLKNMLVKMGSFSPTFQGEHQKKSLKPPPILVYDQDSGPISPTVNTPGVSNHASLHDQNLAMLPNRGTTSSISHQAGHTGVIPAEGAIWILLNHNEVVLRVPETTVTLGRKAQHKVSVRL